MDKYLKTFIKKKGTNNQGRREYSIGKKKHTTREKMSIYLEETNH